MGDSCDIAWAGIHLRRSVTKSENNHNVIGYVRGTEDVAAIQVSAGFNMLTEVVAPDHLRAGPVAEVGSAVCPLLVLPRTAAVILTGRL
jgi:hypothetical protein